MRFFNLKERFYKRLFLIQDFGKKFGKNLAHVLVFSFFLTSLGYFILITVHFGFRDGEFTPQVFSNIQTILYVIFLTKYLSQLILLKKRILSRWIIDGVIFLLSFGVVMLNMFTENGAASSTDFLILNLTVVLLIITELYRISRIINSVRIAPSLLFVISFLFVILIGSGLLMLPNAQAKPVNYFDALFTSASAVCVTGLTVVDTAGSFTSLGKLIILFLIQIGGLGIMTFTGFFGYIFTGSASYKDRLLLKEIISSESLGSLFRVLIQIIFITFLAELAGAVLIYLSVADVGENKFLFSVFHSVSAFCNAGFSTLPGGLNSPSLQHNGLFDLIISGLIIVGGIGFPVMLTLFIIFRNILLKLSPWSKEKKLRWHPVTNNINHRIVIFTTVILLAAGTLLYYLLEKNKSLAGLNGLEPLLVSFFGSVSARTAGFNMVDITAWSYPAIFLMIFLMWVGASPGSTGGGIKTTTFTIALFTVRDFIRGRHNVQIGNREIGRETIFRVLVVIFLSLLVIFTGYFGLLMTDPEKDPVYLLFETFSAYGTVGLSLVDTSTLSQSGKGIIICLMFLGRLGPLTVLSGMFVSNKRQYFKYPKQDLIIN